MTTSTTDIAAAPKQRKPVVPPKRVPADMSVFDYLRLCQPPLDKKIIDIACSQTQVPQELRNDAGQEISMMWSQMTPDTKKYKPGQIAAYAHQMARHAALRLRRELGSSVRLPGSAFRKRKDGTSYVTPGVLATALDWDEMESWFKTDDLTDGGPSGALSGDVAAVIRTPDEEAISEEDSDAALISARLDTLGANNEVLTVRQRELITALVEGASYEDVMAEHGIKKGVLMRELSIAATVLGPGAY
jgi:DNA-directed RNA polymerase specialized sigma24 family protein